MRLLYFIIKRLLQLVPILFGVTIITFITARMLPGNPALLAAGPMGTHEQIAKLEVKMGLDKLIWEQYGIYLRDVFHGDLGTSWRTGQPVTAELMKRFPATFELITMAMVVAVLLAVPLGAIAAVKQGSKLDHFVRIFSVGGVRAALNIHILFPSPLGSTPGWKDRFLGCSPKEHHRNVCLGFDTHLQWPRVGFLTVSNGSPHGYAGIRNALSHRSNHTLQYAGCLAGRLHSYCLG